MQKFTTRDIVVDDDQELELSPWINMQASNNGDCEDERTGESSVQGE